MIRFTAILGFLLSIHIATCRDMRFLWSTRTTTITSFTSTTTNTVSVTPSCFINPGTDTTCVARRRRSLTDEDPIEPTVFINGKKVDYYELIKPLKASATKKKVQEEEISGSVKSMRNGKLYPITYLDKSTTSLVFTAATTTTIMQTATVTFSDCTPSDVSTLIGSICTTTTDDDDDDVDSDETTTTMTTDVTTTETEETTTAAVPRSI